jgi:two-component system cell cycle sensor histidine kinase/response regulator CckA
MAGTRELEAIAKIQSRVARLHGQPFFSKLVLALTEALDVDHAFIGELHGPGGTQSHVLAVAWNRAQGEPFVYDLANSPCETVLAEGDVTLYPSDVAKLFPKDEALARRGIEAYAGTPLRARDGAYLGLLVVMHGKSLADGEAVASLLRLFAISAGDELEKLRMFERQELMLEAADAAGFDWLVEQRSTIWSRHAANVLGLADAPPPDFDRFGDLLDPSSAKVFSTALAALADGSMDALNLTVRTPMGRWLSLRARAKRHSTGALARLSGVATDVSERRMLRERLQRVQTLEAQGRLAGSIAHDFNNLLTVVVGAVDMARKTLGSDSPVGKMLSDGRDAASRAVELSRQLLAFGRPRPPTSVTDVALAVRDIHPVLLRMVGEAITLHVDARGSFPVTIDRTQFEQVLVNLVVNARDAMKGAGTISVSLTGRKLTHVEVATEALSPSGSYVHLCVTDSGPGMDGTTLAAAFSPYFTTKGEQGTGLGLAICHGIVRGALGAIWIDSAIGSGTTVHVLLPLAASDAERPSSSTMRSASGSAS